MHVFFSVGEPSGDEHAARLMTELRQRRPDIQCSGFGGPVMEAAGFHSLYRLTNLAVMGIFEVLPLLWKFYRLVQQARDFFANHRPDAVILVDFPGFNWWIARKAKAAGIPVFYYLPPQLWAWAPWRVKRMQRFVDHVISVLPFERDWYGRHGIQAEYVGHPFFDGAAEAQLDERFIAAWSETAQPIVGVLPGSRNQEIHRNWPVQLEIIKRLHARHPKAIFLVACYKESHRRHCLAQILAHAPTLPIHCFVGRTPEIISVADCALMVSGSVSLELVARQTPAAVMYRVDWPTYLIGKQLVTCAYMSLPNLIAKRRVMPEFLSVGNPRPVIEEATRILDLWLKHPAERERHTQELTQVLGTFLAPGATSRAADVILDRMSRANDSAPAEDLQASRAA